ncbi:MAG: hypothetical protein ACTSUV_04355 [Candidatus Ranarchaeia archaeon]
MQNIGFIDILFSLVYPYLWIVFVVLGVLLSLWLIMIVENEEIIPWNKVAILVVSLALLIGFGIQLFLISIAL